MRTGSLRAGLDYKHVSCSGDVVVQVTSRIVKNYKSFERQIIPSVEQEQQTSLTQLRIPFARKFFSD